METTSLSQSFKVRPLGHDDIPAVLDLCAGNDRYYRFCPPCASAESIGRDMRALPPGKSEKDKFYLGFFDETLTAVIDLITGYPDAVTAFIGFFMVDKDRSAQGIGSKIVTELCACLKTAGYLRVRLGYAKGNEQSEAFWQKNHFVKTGDELPANGYTVIVMQRNL